MMGESHHHIPTLATLDERIPGISFKISFICVDTAKAEKDDVTKNNFEEH